MLQMYVQTAGDTPELWKNCCCFGAAQHEEAALLACPCSDGTLHVLSYANGALETVTQLDVAAHLQMAVMCLCAAFDDEGRRVFVSTSRGRLLSYDTRSWLPILEVQLHADAIDMQWAQVRSIASSLLDNVLELKSGTKHVASCAFMQRARACQSHAA